VGTQLPMSNAQTQRDARRRSISRALGLGVAAQLEVQPAQSSRRQTLAQALEVSTHLAWRRVGRLAVRSRVTREVGMPSRTRE
jgi:hypothetical protein